VRQMIRNILSSPFAAQCAELGIEFTSAG
jgi:hypothetical protein